MHIKRMVFGNAAADGGEGWRTIRKTPQLRSKEESLTKECCIHALRDTKSVESLGSIYFVKRYRTLLLLGYGAAQKVDANGRPGGWLFYCCATKPYRRVLADAVPLSRLLFDNCRSWLKGDALELLKKNDQRVEAMIQNAGSKPADYWQELYPVAAAMEKMLRMQHKRAKSYLFPADRSDHFDVCRSISSPALETSVHRAKWPHMLSVMLSLVIIALGILLYTQMKKHQAALQYLKSAHGKDLKEKDEIIAGRNSTIERLEKYRDQIQSDLDAKLVGADEYVQLVGKQRDNAIRQTEEMRKGVVVLATTWDGVKGDVETFREQAAQIVQSLESLRNEAESLLAMDLVAHEE